MYHFALVRVHGVCVQEGGLDPGGVAIVQRPDPASGRLCLHAPEETHGRALQNICLQMQIPSLWLWRKIDIYRGALLIWLQIKW